MDPYNNEEAMAVRKPGKRGVAIGTVAALGVVVAACGGASATQTSVPLTPQQIFAIGNPGTVQVFGRAQGTSDDDEFGTAVIYDKADGLAITNAHVVTGTTAEQVRFADGSTSPVHVLGVSPCDDVAVIHIQEMDPSSKQLKLGNSSSVHPADSVYVMGYPGSFQDISTEKVIFTSGTVQAANVSAQPDPGSPAYTDTIQHSATINHGNSGGPLLDAKGDVVGINSLIDFGTPDEQVQGQYYSIAINHVKPLLKQLADQESPNYLGWQLVPLSEEPMAAWFPYIGFGTEAQGQTADTWLADNNVDGLLVRGVDPGSAADKGNLDQGDLLQEIQDVPVTTVQQVCDVLQSSLPGSTLELQGRYLTDASASDPFGTTWTDKVVVPKLTANDSMAHMGSGGSNG
jgi:S1-C subfamily serine protease